MPFNISSLLSSFPRGRSSRNDLSEVYNPRDINIYDFNDDLESNTLKRRSEVDLRRCETPKFTYEKSKARLNQKDISNLPQTRKLKMKNDKRVWQDQTSEMLSVTSKNNLSEPMSQSRYDKRSSKELKNSLMPGASKNSGVVKYSNVTKENQVLAQKPCLKQKSNYRHAVNLSLSSQNATTSHFNQNSSSNLRNHRTLSPPSKRRFSSSYHQREELKFGQIQNLKSQEVKYDFETYRDTGHNDSTDEVGVQDISPESVEEKIQMTLLTSSPNQRKGPRPIKKRFTSESDGINDKLASIGIKITSPKSRRQPKKGSKTAKPRKIRAKKVQDHDKNFVVKKRKLDKEEIEGDPTEELASKRAKMLTSHRSSTRAKKPISYYEGDRSGDESVKTQEIISKKEIKDTCYEEEKIGGESVKKQVVKKKEPSGDAEIIELTDTDLGESHNIIPPETVPSPVVSSSREKKNSLKQDLKPNITPISISSDLDYKAEEGSFEDLFVSREFNIAHKENKKIIQNGGIFKVSSEKEANNRVEELEKRELPWVPAGLAEEVKITDVQVQPKKGDVLDQLCTAVEGIRSAVEGIYATMQHQNQIFERFMELFVKHNETNH